MRLEARPRTYAVILLSAYAGAAASATITITLLLRSLSGHGSPAGNLLRVGLAILFFFIGFFFITVGVLYRASFDKLESNDFQ